MIWSRSCVAAIAGDPLPIRSVNLFERLRQIDEVAYVRFASVYRQFPDIETFKTELEKMLRQKKAETVPEAGPKEEE